MANFGFEKMLMCTLFEGGGSEKVYVFGTLVKMLTFLDCP